jgi:hypothetical protein
MKKEFIFSIFLFLIVTILFFFPVFKGHVPFPGDLLITEYVPWTSHSFLGYNPASYPSKFQYFDIINELYPWKMLVVDHLKNGQIPLWNPYNFSGTPLLANLQSQVFAPFNIFYFILPTTYSWTIGLMLQTILALVFTYLYARQIKFSMAGSLLSSIAFSCSLYMSVFFQFGVIGQTVLWLPLLTLYIEKIIERVSLKSILVLIAGITFAGFGGHIQIFFYVVLFTVAYLFIRMLSLRQERVKKIFLFLFCFFIAFGILAIQLIPTMELIGLSARVPHDPVFITQHLLLKFNELILFISPDFYGNPATNNYLLDRSYPQTALYIGIIPLIFALSTLFSKKNNFAIFYIFITITLLAITRNPISSLFYSINIPFISSSSSTNGIFIISFSLSLLAGYGFDQWIARKNKFVLWSAFSLLVILISAVVLNSVMHISFSFKNVVYSLLLICISLVVFSVSKFSSYRKVLPIILIVITIVDLFYFFHKFNPFVPNVLVFPKVEVLEVLQQKAGINRVWGYGTASMTANTNSIYYLFSPDGIDPLYPKMYGEFIYATRDGKIFEKFDRYTRSNVTIDSSLGSFPDKYVLKTLNTLGVSYIIDRTENGSTEKNFPESKYPVEYEKGGWKLYKNSAAAKRIFLTSDYQIYHSNQEFEKMFFSESFDPSQTILLEKRPNFAAQKNNSTTDKITNINYKAEEITITVETNMQKMLFLSDTYYPGWKAYVDKQETQIFKADYTFRAIVVPKGKHQIIFRYEPLSFYYGYKVTLFSLIILIIVSGVIYMRKSYYEK